MRRDYYFNPELAEKYGVDEAIFLHHLAFWIQKNISEGVNIKDGRCWTYMTLKGFREIFPFWKDKNKMARIAESCRKQGLILTGHYSENKMDRTTWYALTDDMLRFYNMPLSLPEMNEKADAAEMGNAIPENGKCNTQNREMLYGKYKSNKDNTPCNPPEGAEGFNAFWTEYPRKIDKQRAFRAWQRQKIKPEALPQILAALRAQKASSQWRRDGGQYIPHPTTWINNRRWEAECGVEAEASGTVEIPGGVELWT